MDTYIPSTPRQLQEEHLTAISDLKTQDPQLQNLTSTWISMGFSRGTCTCPAKKKTNQKTAPASAVSKWLAFTIKKPYRTSSQEMKWISPPTRIRENPQKTGSWRIWQLTLNLFLPSPAPYHPPSIYSFFGLGRWLGCWLSIRLHGPPEVETHRRNSFGKEINFRHGRSWENRLQHLRHRVTSRCRRSKRHKHKQSMT